MRLLRRPDRHLGMTDADRDELRKRGLEADTPVIEDYMRQARKTLSDDAVTHQILATGAPAHARNVAAARTHLFRALASASARAQLVFDNEIIDAPDPVRALLQNLGKPSAEVARMLGHTTSPISPPRLPRNGATTRPSTASSRRWRSWRNTWRPRLGIRVCQARRC